MALRLIRKASEEPNITNTDDVVMVRYAYGYNGVVKNYGKECAHEVTSSEFKILSGRIVVDGWEVDVPVEGEIIDFSETYGVQYVTIFAEIELIAETATIKAEFNLINYPEILKEDDLTEIPKGSSKFELYNVRVENGIITEVLSKFEIIPRLQDIGGKVKDIEEGKIEVGKSKNTQKIADVEVTNDGKNFKYSVGGLSLKLTAKRTVWDSQSNAISIGESSANTITSLSHRLFSLNNLSTIEETLPVEFKINGQWYKADIIGNINTFVVCVASDVPIGIAYVQILYQNRTIYARYYSTVSISKPIYLEGINIIYE